MGRRIFGLVIAFLAHPAMGAADPQRHIAVPVIADGERFNIHLCGFILPILALVGQAAEQLVEIVLFAKPVAVSFGLETLHRSSLVRRRPEILAGDRDPRQIFKQVAAAAPSIPIVENNRLSLHETHDQTPLGQSTSKPRCRVTRSACHLQDCDQK